MFFQRHMTLRPKTVGAGRRVAMALAFALSALGASAGSAAAANPIYIKLHNRTNLGSPATVQIVAARDSACWDNEGLDDQPGHATLGPGDTRTYYTAKSLFTFNGCGVRAGNRGIDLKVREPGSERWYTPAGTGDYRFDYTSEYALSPYYPGLYIIDTNRTWLPRADGRGLICWRTTLPLPTYPGRVYHPEIFVYSDYTHCNVPGPGNIAQPGWTVPSALATSAHAAAVEADARAGAPTPAHTAQAGSDKIVDVLGSVGVACGWYVSPMAPARCAALDVGNQANWSLENLSSEIRNFKITKTVGSNDPKTPIGAAQVSIPMGSPSGTVSVTRSLSTTETTTSSTQHGGKVGSKTSFKAKLAAKIPFVAEGGGELSQEFSAEYSFTKTDTESTSKSETRTVGISVGASPGYTTRLEVFTSKRAANYLYEADLNFGKARTDENVTTPANVALDQSPARRQPCLAYVVGDSQVRNSITYVGQQLFDAGFRQNDSSLPPERRAFLGSIRSYQSNGNAGTQCPGFPAHYASVAGFKGQGVGTYDNLGYDEKGNPVQVVTGCVYQTPYPPRTAARSQPNRRATTPPPDARPAQATSPCRAMPINSEGVQSVGAPGNLIDDRSESVHAAREAGSIVGPPGSNEILGPNAGGTIYTGNGAVDIVLAGRGNTRVYGGGGENLLFGGAGNDVLVGGRGGANYLHAGTGTTLLSESNGRANMYGGPGRDTFVGHNMSGVMVGGSSTNDMIVTGDESRVEMTAGPRSRTLYELRGFGTPSIVQLPGGRATIKTDHSLNVAPYVQTAIATGSRAVTLRGSIGTSKLVANRGRDVLVAGPDPAVLLGGAGRDTIVFNPFNSDVARGGRGADRYQFTGTPESFQRPLALERPTRRSAATVVNFNPRKGDRLVLSAAVFGRQIWQLRDVFTLVANANPWPKSRRPTLLLDTRTGVLSFDRDGTGPISDKVIVKLTGYRMIQRNWIIFTR